MISYADGISDDTRALSQEFKISCHIESSYYILSVKQLDCYDVIMIIQGLLLTERLLPVSQCKLLSFKFNFFTVFVDVCFRVFGVKRRTRWSPRHST